MGSLLSLPAFPAYQKTSTGKCMKTTLKLVCILILGLKSAPLQGSPTVLVGDHEISADVPNGQDGNLLVNGTLSAAGNIFDFGTTGSNDSALAWEYAESGSTYTLSLNATREATSFLWRDNAGATPAAKMSLDGNNVLTIYDTSGNPAIVLDPADPVGPATALIQEVGDGRYIQNSSYLAVGIDAWAGGINSAAFGYGALAVEADSIALGSLASAEETNSIAIGVYSRASGYGAFAAGPSTIASGDGSVALGSESVASGAGTVSLGCVSVASGDFSTAIGYFAIASGYGQFAIGQSNVSQGNATEWVETDDLFIVGNGIQGVSQSNAMTVWKNGGLRTAGTAEFKGGARVAPRGDLSMGDFTAGANPADLDSATGLRYSGE